MISEILMQFSSGLLYGVTLNSCNDVVLGLMEQVSYEPYNITNTVLALISSSFIIGLTLGSILCQYINRKVKTYNLLIISTITAFIFSILQFLSVHYLYTFFIRIIIGFFQAQLNTLIPAFLSTKIQAKYQKQFQILYQVSICFGIFIETITLFIINNKAQRYWVSLILTPVFYITEIIGLAFLQNKNDQQQINIQQGKLKAREVANAIIVGFTSQFNGINAIIVYSTSLLAEYLQQAGDQAQAFSQLIITGVNFIATLIALIVIPLLKKQLKWLYCGGQFICCFCLVFFALCDTVVDSSAVAFIFMVIYLISFECAPGSLPWMLQMHMFTDKNRTKLNSIMQFVMWLTNILIVFCFPYFTDMLWIAYTIFIVCTFILDVILLFTYEDQNQIQQTQLFQNFI